MYFSQLESKFKDNSYNIGTITLLSQFCTSFLELLLRVFKGSEKLKVLIKQCSDSFIHAFLAVTPKLKCINLLANEKRPPTIISGHTDGEETSSLCNCEMW